MIRSVLAVLALAPAVAAAQTSVSGTQSGTWTLASSPYVITGAVDVPTGTTLTVEPGVEVRFDGHYPLTVHGTLWAMGTESAPILFTRNSPTDASRGAGIRFDTADGGELIHVIVEHGYADNGTWDSSNDDRGGGIFVYNTPFVLRSSVLRDNEASTGAGLYIANYGGQRVEILRNDIHDNDAVSSGFNACGGGGLYVSGGSNILVANNLIYGNAYVGGAPNFEGGGGATLRNADLEFVHNTVWGNTAQKGPGLLIAPGGTYGLFVQNNIVAGNSGGYNSEAIAIQTSTSSGGSVSPNFVLDRNLIDADVVKVYRTTFESTWYGTNTLTGDPNFFDAAGGDFFPSYPSPVHDAADSTTMWLPQDYYGEERVDSPAADTGVGAAPLPDVGAVEWVCHVDLDGDNLCDHRDNCPTVPSTDLTDSDGDGIGDVCDACVGDNTTGDTDADGVCDSDDLCLGPDYTGDTDADGTCDLLDDDDDGDGCADAFDPAPTTASGDTDGDGVANDCDPCPTDPYDDSDGDGSCDSDDLCTGLDFYGDADSDGLCGDVDTDDDGDGCTDWTDAAPAMASGDSDSDGVADDCDPCPADPYDDSDGDGSCDSDDLCYGHDPIGDTDGDGVCDDLDHDDDGDGCTDTADASPLVAASDLDGDGHADDCDPCPLDNPDDSDGDGVCESEDLCIGPDALGDSDGNGICDLNACTDTDGDGVCDAADRCDGDDATGDADGDSLCGDLDPCFGDNASGDLDGDGACAEYHGEVWDCDDEKPTVFPGAPELCDGLDNACAGAVPDEDEDADADGVSICAGDCDDADPQRYPGAEEICDGLDSDCDGAPPLDELDADGDGYRSCEECDDLDAARHPGATEACDGVDNDCDGVLPDDELDADRDGWLVCEEDCDDTLPSVNPGLGEFCYDGVDNDCDGAIDEDCLADPGDPEDKGCSTLGGASSSWLAVLLGLAAVRRRRRG